MEQNRTQENKKGKGEMETGSAENKKAKLNIKEMSLSELHPAEYNPRIDLKPGDPEYERIKRSIETFTYVDPIIANKDGTIIGGHQRYKVLLDLGYKKADVVIVDKTKEEEKALNVALNKITGEWDEEALRDVLIDLNSSGMDLDLTGFTQDEYANLCEGLKESPIDLDEQESTKKTAYRCPKCGFEFEV